MEKGNFKESIELFESIVQLNPDSQDALFNLAVAYIQTKDFENAEIKLDEYLRINPNDSDAWYLTAKTLQALNRLDDTMYCLYNAIKLNPTFEDAYSDLVLVLIKNGKIDEAIEELKRAFDLNLNIDPATIGHIYLIKGEINEALTFYNENLNSYSDKSKFLIDLKVELNFLKQYGVGDTLVDEILSAI